MKLAVNGADKSFGKKKAFTGFWGRTARVKRR